MRLPAWGWRRRRRAEARPRRARRRPDSSAGGERAGGSVRSFPGRPQVSAAWPRHGAPRGRTDVRHGAEGARPQRACAGRPQVRRVPASPGGRQIAARSRSSGKPGVWGALLREEREWPACTWDGCGPRSAPAGPPGSAAVRDRKGVCACVRGSPGDRPH